MILKHFLNRYPAQISYSLLFAGALMVWVSPISKLPASRPRPPAPPETAIITVPAIPDMSQLIARPIFSETRRPPPVAKKPLLSPSLPAATTAGMVLLGVLNTGKTQVALVTLPGGNQPYLVAPGDKLGDWMVTKILTGSIMLKSGNHTGMLTLPKPVSNDNLATPAPMPQNSLTPTVPHYPGSP